MARQETWPYFPLPVVTDGGRFDGSLLSMPSECRTCTTRECELAESIEGVGLCRYGFNYLRLAKDSLIFGFLVAGEPAQHKLHRRNLRKYGRQALWPEELEQLKSRRAELEAKQRITEESATREAEEHLLTSIDGQAAVLDRLEDHVRASAGQLHDYIDLASQILKQLNRYMHDRYPDIEIPSDLDAAPDELQSIYWLARLMEEKVSAFGYYLHPESVKLEVDTFRLHGLVTKYRKMYQRACE